MKKDKKSPVLVTLSFNVPASLAEKARTCAGYFNKGDLGAWFNEAIECVVEGSLDSMHADLAKLCDKVGK